MKKKIRLKFGLIMISLRRDLLAEHWRMAISYIRIKVEFSGCHTYDDSRSMHGQSKLIYDRSGSMQDWAESLTNWCMLAQRRPLTVHRSIRDGVWSFHDWSSWSSDRSIVELPSVGMHDQGRFMSDPYLTHARFINRSMANPYGPSWPGLIGSQPIPELVHGQFLWSFQVHLNRGCYTNKWEKIVSMSNQVRWWLIAV